MERRACAADLLILDLLIVYFFTLGVQLTVRVSLQRLSHCLRKKLVVQKFRRSMPECGKMCQEIVNFPPKPVHSLRQITLFTPVWQIWELNHIVSLAEGNWSINGRDWDNVGQKLSKLVHSCRKLSWSCRYPVPPQTAYELLFLECANRASAPPVLVFFLLLLFLLRKNERGIHAEFFGSGKI